MANMMTRDDLEIEDISDALLVEEKSENVVKSEVPEEDAFSSLLEIASVVESKAHPVDYVHRLTHKFKTLLKEGKITKTHLASLGEKLVSYDLNDDHASASLLQMIKDTYEKLPIKHCHEGTSRHHYRNFLDTLLQEVPHLSSTAHPFLKRAVYHINHDLLR
jgi:hypothetical protein